MTEVIDKFSDKARTACEIRKSRASKQLSLQA